MSGDKILKINKILEKTKYKDYEVNIDFLPKRVGLGYEFNKLENGMPLVKKKLNLRQHVLKKKRNYKEKDIQKESENISKGSKRK